MTTTTKPPTEPVDPLKLSAVDLASYIEAQYTLKKSEREHENAKLRDARERADRMFEDIMIELRSIQRLRVKQEAAMASQVEPGDVQ